MRPVDPSTPSPEPAPSALESVTPDLGSLVAVAVPVPLQGALTYGVPARWEGQATVGCRVKVRVGPRSLTGLIIGRPSAAPVGVTVRPIDEVIDPAPILPADLLELARFAADYYLAPIGEVLKVMLPSELTAWGSRRVRLRSSGALAPTHDDTEAAIVAALMETGPTTMAALQSAMGRTDILAKLEALHESGRVRIEDGSRTTGSRYRNAVELPASALEQQLEACGRSAPARAVVEYLSALGRPATVREVSTAVECGPGVIRRLVSLGVLRQFTEIERLDLGVHVLSGESGTAPSDIVLRPDQASAADRLCQALSTQSFSPFVLAGITGSGKTEVYLRAVERTLEQGRSAIILVPEIALVPALARSVLQRYGDRLAILHSNLGRSERQQEWERIRAGKARVVLGPRSAVFAPVSDLGLVVVDEEQDGAYKQDKSPRYNGRDLALVRAREAESVAVLVSATPSLETRHNTERGRFESLQLTARVGQGRLPEGILVDLRNEAPRRPGEIHFSTRLIEELEQTLEAGDQIILLRNRRGYSPLYLCRACGEDMRCEDCGLPRTFHRRDGRLICHYCGSRSPVPRCCPSCREEAFEAIGAGTERVEEDFRSRFPGVHVGVLDRDAARRRGGAAAVIERFGSGKDQVLIGTQMVSKGHHFPRVAMTAVLSADSYLGFPDFRAVERTYTLLTQLAGRAGRGDRPGRVVIQTYHPDHYAIRAALEHDDSGFAAEEMRFRRIFHYPPFSRMIQLLLRDSNRLRAEERIRDLAERVRGHPLAGDMRILGPAPAPLEKLRGRWRYQLVLRGSSSSRLRRLVRETLEQETPPDLIVDVDPYDLL